MDKKQKIKKILFWILNIICYIFSAIFSVILIVSCASRPQKNNNQTNNLYKPHEILNVSYDDSEYKITLTANELNNYIWVNLADWWYNEEGYTYSLNNTTINYNGVVLVLDEQMQEDFVYTNGYSITFISDESQSLYQKFSFNNGDDDVPFSYDIVWDLYCSELYSLIKPLIEKDIAYNQNPLDYSIFDGLTDGIINFVDTLNVGITNIVTIFYASGNLTPIGLLTVIVVAVSIVWLVFRLVIGLIRLRG